VEVIAIDSVQGRGLSSNAVNKFQALFEFAALARAQGLVVILVEHVTKNGMIAGPKTLEHNVDCILYLPRAFRLRPFFVPKNRFGPAVNDPVVLIMDEQGRLTKSRLSVAKLSAVFGYSGVGDGVTEVQAAVSLPKYGCRPELLAPFLPEKRIRQLVGVLSTLREIELADLSYQINCYLPRQQRYREELDLPLAIASRACADEVLLLLEQKPPKSSTADHPRLHQVTHCLLVEPHGFDHLSLSLHPFLHAAVGIRPQQN